MKEIWTCPNSYNRHRTNTSELEDELILLLDKYEMNYSSWVYFFINLCKGFELLKHILGESTDEATFPTPEWLKVDSIVPSWIFMTLSKTVQAWLVVEDAYYETPPLILYEYETFKSTEGELFLDTYIRYLQVINDLKKCGYSKDNCELNFKFLNNLQPEWKQYATMMRQNKNLMDINIDALYNILKQNQGDVNDAMGSKKKTIVITFETLDLIAEKTNVSRRSEADDFSELKKITTLLAKAFNQRKFYFKPTNNNLRTSSSSQSANKKQEFVKTDNKRVEKKDDEKKRDMSKTKMLLAKKDKDEQVILAEDQAWMESSSDSDHEINANMVFMAQIEKVLSDSEASSSFTDEKISENRVEKANQQSKDFKNQNKDLQDNYDVLKNQMTTFEMNNNELNEKMKDLIEKNNDLLAQMKVLKEQLQVKHVVIDTHVECQEKYAKLEAERYEYMIRYSAYFDNDKQHRKQIADQELLYDKISVQLVKLDKHVRDLKNTV
nr:hybrid signal transduction histidine kinase M [Tanacetum cinerariifolium]